MLLLLMAVVTADAAAAARLRVVTDNNYPPYVFVGESGEAEGYTVDLWRLWERKTGVPVDFRAMQWADAQRAMRDQEADVIDLIFRTPVREQLYTFSAPYATLPVSIYVDTAIQGIQNVASLGGFTVGVQRGDACVDELTSKGITNLMAFTNYEAILAAAGAGQIKMFCMDDAPANYYLYLHREKVRFTRAFKLYEGQFHWAVNREDAQTYETISRGMALITDAERAELRDRWFKQPFEFRPYVRAVSIAMLVSLSLIGAAGLWIYVLRRAVKTRTAEIRHKHRQLELTARELRVEEALLRAIIESSPDAMVLKSPDGIYLDCNAGMLALLGLSREEVLGKSDKEVFANRNQMDFIRTSDREVMLNGKPMQYETTIVGDDGSTRHIEVAKALVHDTHGVLVGVVSVGRDITERRRLDNELRTASVAFESNDGMMITDARGVIERVNAAFCRISGFAPEEAVGKTSRMLQSGLHDQAFYEQMDSTLARDGYWHGEIVNRHRNGNLYTARLSITVVTDSDGNTQHYVGNLQDITAEVTSRELAERLKRFDPLTDLPNRLMLEERMLHALARHAELQRCGAIMMMDIDLFQRVNDSLGHSVGDQLLIEAGRRIRQTTRDGDTVGRFSGDSFLLIAEMLGAEPSEAASRAQALAEAVRLAVQAPFVLDGHQLICTTSIGVTLMSGQETSADILLRQAELAMYESKARGRNTVRFFESAMQAQIEHRSWLEKELRQAIEQQQFELYYQVQVNVHGQPIGAEALLRWTHPQRGIVAPSEFIPLAEETGLIDPIGKWVLAQACRQLAHWTQQPDTRQLTLAINISPRQFRSSTFAEDLTAEVTKSGAPAQHLKLEVTESMAIENLDDSLLKLQALRESGFKISLDDFGTGNSSLNVLTKLPLTQLKIDKSFVDHLPSNQRDVMVAQTIIHMGRGLGLDVIAEGVESVNQFDCLVHLGCQAFQGYLFGRPMPVRAFEANLHSLRERETTA